MHTKMEVTVPERRAPTDAELLRDAASSVASSTHAFRNLYDRYAERIHAYHLRRTRDPEAAHDLAAETFAQAWLSRTRFRDEAGGSAGPWLFAIARHVVLRSVERGRLEQAATQRLGVLELLDRPPATAAPDETWLDGLDDDVRWALEALPEGQRTAVELRIVDDLSYEQVGETLGTTSRAARVRVHRGLRALRSRLDGTEASR
jgi:RNA polymerase sigma-70 factor (ECF subfamily)